MALAFVQSLHVERHCDDFYFCGFHNFWQSEHKISKFWHFEQYIFPKLDNFDNNLISAEFIHVCVCLSHSLSIYIYNIWFHQYCLDIIHSTSLSAPNTYFKRGSHDASIPSLGQSQQSA
jgi:hypothetical protein